MTRHQSRLYRRITEPLHREESGWPRRFISRIGKTAYEVVEKFWQDDCLTYASALAYTSLLALAPLTAVSLSLVSSFEVSKDALLEFFFERLLPNREMAIVIEENFDTFANNAAEVSLLGLVFLIFFSVWVLSTIEYSFNMIWRVKSSRPLVSKLVTYWSAVTFAPILIALSIYLTARIQSVLAQNQFADLGVDYSLLTKTTPYILSTIAFFLVYKLMPYTRVGIRSAFIGALLAGLMFEQAKHGFNWYLIHFAKYEDIYGAMAVLPIFLFWLYLTWLIVLLGSVIAYAIEHPGEIENIESGFDPEEYSVYFTLCLLFDIAESFEKGEGSVDRKELIERYELTDILFDKIIGLLLEADLLEKSGEGNGRFILKMAPAKISMAVVLAKTESTNLSVPPGMENRHDEKLAGIFKNAMSGMKNSLGSETLATLIGGQTP